MIQKEAGEQSSRQRSHRWRTGHQREEHVVDVVRLLPHHGRHRRRAVGPDGARHQAT